MSESGQTQRLWLRAGGDELTLSSPDIANPQMPLGSNRAAKIYDLAAGARHGLAP